MYLAMRNGQLGRKVRQMGDDAQIAQPPCADPTTSVYVSAQSVQDAADLDAATQAAQDYTNAQNQAYQDQCMAEDVANQTQMSNQIATFQNMKPEDPEMATLRRYYAFCNRSTEQERVLRSIKPDFTMEALAPGQPFTEPTQNPNADFNIFELQGNPLTRDGSYGVVTDYDRFENGTELTGAEVHYGTPDSIMRKVPATSAYAYDDSNEQAASMGRMGRRPSYMIPRAPRHPMMGDDGDDLSSLDAVSIDYSAPAPAPVPVDDSAAQFAAFDAAPNDPTTLTAGTPAPATSTSSSGGFWSNLLSSASTAATTAAQKAATAAKPGTSTTPASVVAAANASSTNTTALLMIGGFGVVAIGTFIMLKKKKKFGKSKR